MARRVVMVCGMFPPSIGGIQTHTLHLGQALAAEGARVRVLTRRHKGLAARERMGEVEVIRVGDGDAPRGLATASFVAATLAYLARHRRDIDVVHAHQLLSPTTIGLLAKATLGLPLVVQPHACGAIGDVAVAGAPRLAAARRMADAVVAISQPIEQELLDAGFSCAQVERISNGVDTAHFHPVESEAERRGVRETLGLPPGLLVVYAGRLAPEKGVDVLLDAWPTVKAERPDATLCLLGSGNEEAALKTRAAGLEGVLFRGAVADVQPFLRAADASVLPSRTEGLPIALLEAMAVGLPIAATAVGGTPEVLEDNVSGRLCPPERPRALAEALLQVLGTEEGARLGRRARSHVVQNYSLMNIARSLLSLYASVSPRVPAEELALDGARR